MGKPNAAKMLKTTKIFLSKNSPSILTGLGITGMLATTVISVKQTPKALMLIEEEKDRLELGTDDKLTIKETVKATWKVYIPAAAICVASMACLIGANSVNTRRNAALATAYKLTETAFSDYKEKVVAEIGEKKDKAIREDISKDKLADNPVSKSEIFITEKGNTLCFDPITSRYFKSDIDRIKKAENEINKRLLHEMYMSLNDFYELIGLSDSSLGDDLGWNIDKGFLELDFSSLIAEDGTPCIVLEYSVAPQYGYDKLS